MSCTDIEVMEVYVDGERMEASVSVYYTAVKTLALSCTKTYKLSYVYFGFLPSQAKTHLRCIY